MMGRWLFVAGLDGFVAVALGAFGAHGLKDKLAAWEDGAKRLEWWHTAAQYQLMHALALGLVALLLAKVPLARAAGVAFVLGTALFCGSLYAMTLGAPRGLGLVTPLGGLAFLAGWAVLAVGGLRAKV